MAHITETRIGESTTTTGTGDVALGGSLTSHKTFSAVMSAGDTCFYDIAAVDTNGAETGDWEEGLGTYNLGNVLTRTTVLRSSNLDAAVSFSAGTKYVRLVAERRQVAAVPRGGSANYVLTKASGTDYDTQWSAGAQNAFSTVAVSGQSDVVADSSSDTLNLAAGTNITLTTDATTDTVTIAASGGSPGGASGTIQYNNSSAFDGMSGTSWDDTNRSLTITGATVTASKPVFDLAQTWNSAGVTFTGLKLNVTNTASAAASMLVDLQAGGASAFRVQAAGGGVTTAPSASVGSGSTTSQGWVLGNFSSGASGLWATSVTPSTSNFTLVATGTGATYINAPTTIYLRNNNTDTFAIASTATSMSGVMVFGWTNGSSAAAIDTAVSRNAAGVVEVNNGTGGTFRDLKLRNLLAGGGNGSYIQTPSMTVANLAAAATAGAGATAFVTDAATTLALGIGTTVTGGGANKVPVYSDGTNWLYG